MEQIIIHTHEDHDGHGTHSPAKSKCGGFLTHSAHPNPVEPFAQVPSGLQRSGFGHVITLSQLKPTAVTEHVHVPSSWTVP